MPYSHPPEEAALISGVCAKTGDAMRKQRMTATIDLIRDMGVATSNNIMAGLTHVYVRMDARVRRILARHPVKPGTAVEWSTGICGSTCWHWQSWPARPGRQT